MFLLRSLYLKDTLELCVFPEELKGQECQPVQSSPSYRDWPQNAISRTFVDIFSVYSYRECRLHSAWRMAARRPSAVLF